MSGQYHRLDHLDVTRLLTDAEAAIQQGSIDQVNEMITPDCEHVIDSMLKKDPANIDLIFMLANVLWKCNQEHRAEQWYRKILKFGPNAKAHDRLGCLYQYTGRMIKAQNHYEKALQIEPEQPGHAANLARVLMETGQIETGLDMLKKVLSQLSNSRVHSNYLFRLHHLPSPDLDAMLDEHTGWQQLYAPEILAKRFHPNMPDPDRKLRIGYISPDFRRSSVAYFFESLLDGHRRDQFELYGYGNVEFPDNFTARFKDKFDHYTHIIHMNDAEVVECIETDEIDILVDLAGHTGGNRLTVMAYKPAPIQVTYLGYPDTTGISQIDYRLTDRLADKPDHSTRYTETLLFLDSGFLCYRPPDFAPLVEPLPAIKNGYITFGSFNNNCKLNSQTAKVWSEIIRQVPNAALLLKIKGAADNHIQSYYRDMFTACGLNAEKIEIIDWCKLPQDHLALYNRIDIALDTFPYNGTTTTCEALWMGVPVISRIGDHHMSRTGLSILSKIGLAFFAASNDTDYIAKAVSLAQNTAALSRIRISMRGRIAASGLCCAKMFAADVEKAYRKIWRAWCNEQNAVCHTRKEVSV